MKKCGPYKLKASFLICLFLFFLGGNLTRAQQSIEVDPADQLRIPTPQVLTEEVQSPVMVYPGPRPIDRVALGLGIGMDYGGLGGSVLVHPQKYIGLFAGVGYNLCGAGVNGGIRLRYIGKREGTKITPFFLAMYGYNATVFILDVSRLNKTYYGTTLGGGIDFYPGSDALGYWSFGLLIPFRSQDVFDYIDYLESQYGADFGGGLLPFALTVGYRFIIR